jgi:hypothetical protein
MIPENLPCLTYTIPSIYKIRISILRMDALSMTLYILPYFLHFVIKVFAFLLSTVIVLSNMQHVKVYASTVKASEGHNSISFQC